MRHERQVELLDRVGAAGERLVGLHAEHTMVNPASAYVDPDRFRREQDRLFRDGPVFFAMSCELPDPGSWVSATFDGVPLVVVRQPDGSVRAMVNACRHRGAPLVPLNDRGTMRAFSCPYHAWAYNTDGRLKARPLAEEAFDDVEINCDLHTRPVAEAHGVILVRPEGDEAIDVTAFLSGAEDDFDAFGFVDYVPIETRINTWDMNWKLFFDTFTESYHIRTLHRNTLAPTFNSECTIFEAFGRNLLSIGLRKDVLDELDKPVEEQSLLPYGTIQYFLVPNALVVHQVDHLEVWRVDPLAIDSTRTTTTVYAPTEPHSEKARQYFVKNLDLLLKVTGTEDFPTMADIQRGMASGAVPQLVYGKNEPPLVYFHSVLNEICGI